MLIFLVYLPKIVKSVFEIMGKFKSHMTICQKPDSTSKTLINDYMNEVDMSTYLSDGKILIKVQ